MKRLQKLRYPRWLAIILWSLMLLLGHTGLPAGLADLTPRLGWRNGQLRLWNQTGLFFVMLGYFYLGWCVFLHYKHSSRKVKAVMRTPPELLIEDPYR